MIHTNIPLEMKKCNYFDFTIVDDVFQYFFLTILCWFMIFKGILMFFFKVLSLFSWFFTVLSLSLSTMYRSSLKLSHSVKYAKNALLEALFIHHCAQKQIPGSVLIFVCALLLKNLGPNCYPTKTTTTRGGTVKILTMQIRIVQNAQFYQVQYWCFKFCFSQTK